MVVVFAGAAVDMSDWEGFADAILYAGFPGMGGDAVIADILTGAVCPSGKLSESFAFSCVDEEEENIRIGVTRYAEGLGVGYRGLGGRSNWVDFVEFPFGFGLSYASFAYEGLTLAADEEGVEVRFAVRNLSEICAKEAVQVYVRECAPLVWRPEKELQAFAKEEIPAGGSREFCIRLNSRAFSHWSAALDRWQADDGVFEIQVGASSADIRLRAKVRLEKGKFIVL